MTAKPSISPKRRYPSGQVVERDTTQVRETPEQVLAVAQWQRSKLGATQDNYRDQKWSCPLGKLRLWAMDGGPEFGLSERQYQAIIIYAQHRHLSRWAQGFGPEHPKSFSLDSIGGASLAEEPSDETIMQLRRQHNGARSCLLQYLDRGVSWCNLLDKLARDEEGDAFWRSAAAEVRCAANLLAVHYGLHGRK